jgi:hypothetical protein
MKRSLAFTLTAGLLLAPLAWAETAKKAASCGDFGTTVVFAENPKDAAKQAEKEQKLVMVLHISGHFEDPGLT